MGLGLSGVIHLSCSDDRPITQSPVKDVKHMPHDESISVLLMESSFSD